MELDEILENKITIKVANQDVVLDPKLLHFTEVTLSRYEDQEGVWYDYFGNKLALAEAELQYHELQLEKLESKKFIAYKELGGSDKLAEAKVKCDDEYIAASEIVILAKEKVKHIQQHLRAWDKNHENAQSRGHMIRKEMDKLHYDSYVKGLQTPKSELDTAIDNIIGKSKE